MRSWKRPIIGERHVAAVAENWLSEALPFRSPGWKCTVRVLWALVLVAAARVSSLFAACADLSEAPTDEAVRRALRRNLPKRPLTLERRFEPALCGHLPKRLTRRARHVAIDWHLIPYHGEPLRSKNELYHSAPKSGTTKFHVYATACVVQHGSRYTLAATWVKGDESSTQVLTRLLDRIADLGLRIKTLLLDKQFFTTPVISLLKSRRIPFLMPLLVRGRKPKKKRGRPAQPGRPNSPRGFGKKRTTSRKRGKRTVAKTLRDFFRAPAGRHPFTWTVKGVSVSFHVVVAYKTYHHHRTGKRCQKKLLFAAWNVSGTPVELRERYRTRFGIEASYRQLGQARIRTCTPDPLLRLFFVLVSLVLRNIWVWLHDTYFTLRQGPREIVHLECLRFRRMLHWIETALATQFHNGAEHRAEIPP
jgi:hypothetical protein